MSMTTHNFASEDTSAMTLMTTLGTTFSTLNISEGGYDYELLGVADSRYECPICLLCFRDPVLTTCGHKFCSKCIGNWVVNHGGKCPVDSVSLSAENIFPDNYTRREIMQSKAKCPFTKEGCEKALPINELERHIQTDHLALSLNTSAGRTDGSPFSPGDMVVMECSFKEVGCDIRLPRSELQRHQDADLTHHFQLVMAAYKRLKIITSSRSNLEYPSNSHDGFWRQDSRDSTRMLLDDSLESDDYQFRREDRRSWDSVRMARKQHTRPRFHESRLAESDESLCKPHHNHSGESQKVSSKGSEGSEPQMKDIFERLVRLEQTDREKQIKIEVLESRLASAVNLFSTATQIIKDLTARYCHGVFVWKIPDFKKLCLDMRKNPNRVLNSPGFYTDTFGYKLCLRFNLTTPSSLGAAAPQPVDIPLEQDEDTFISLYVHFMQGEFDDTLRWPFNGEMNMIVIHPSIPEDSITETMYSKPDTAAFAKPTLPRNPKGFGYPEFCSLNRVFSSGFVKNDTLFCKILAKAS